MKNYSKVLAVITFKNIIIGNISTYINIRCKISLKEPGLITSDVFHRFSNFGIRRKPTFFSLPLVNFTAEKCTVWKILMRT